MNYNIRTIIIKIIKCAAMEAVSIIFFLTLQVTGFMDLFKEDIPYISLIEVLVVEGLFALLVFLYVLMNNEINSLHDYIKSHFHFFQILIGINEMVLLYKCKTEVHFMLTILESSVLLLLLDFEISKIYKYGAPAHQLSYSYYVEKPVVGRDNLTKTQICTLDKLKVVLDNRKSNDSFNVALIGAWGSGKTSVTDTLISEYEKEDTYLLLKIGTLTLRESANVATYVKNYFENLFRHYEVGLFSFNVAFLTTLASILTKSKTIGDIFGSVENNVFFDLEKEKELFSRQVSKLLRVSGKKNVLLFIDDTDRCDDEDQVIKLLQEFASIEGIISVVSLDKSRDILSKSITEEGKPLSIYSALDKYIHVRVRMEDDNHIEYDKTITEQLLYEYDSLKHNENCYISCDGVNSKNSLFDEVRDYQTFEKSGKGITKQDPPNILTDVFFENLKENKNSFGKHLEALMNEYLYQTKELLPGISKMKSIPHEQWSIELFTLYAQWTNVIDDERFDWLMRLQSNAGTIFWNLGQMYEAVDLIISNVEIQDEVKDIIDAVDYYMITKMPNTGRTWKNRKNTPVIYGGMDQIKGIAFEDEEYSRLNELIKRKEYDEVKDILKDKIGKGLNLYYKSVILVDFMVYLRGILNNNRTFKMQLREAELSNQNYLDYIIKEWQTTTEVYNNIEKSKEGLSVLKEINNAGPSLNAIINNVLFENYIYRFGTRFYKGELKDSRIILIKGDDRALLCVTHKEGSLGEEYIIDLSGNEIKEVSAKEIERISELKKAIWEP